MPWITITIKNSSGQMWQLYMHMLQMNPLYNNWLTMGWARDSQTCTQPVDSLFCITCLLENNAFSVLHCIIKVPLHFLMWHRFEIVHGFIRLPPCSLASSRDCSLAIHVLNIIINYNDWSQLTSKMIIYEWGIGDQGNWKSTYVKKFHPF